MLGRSEKLHDVRQLRSISEPINALDHFRSLAWDWFQGLHQQWSCQCQESHHAHLSLLLDSSKESKTTLNALFTIEKTSPTGSKQPYVEFELRKSQRNEPPLTVHSCDTFILGVDFIRMNLETSTAVPEPKKTMDNDGASSNHPRYNLRILHRYRLIFDPVLESKLGLPRKCVQR